MKFIIQFKFKQETDGRIKITFAAGDKTYTGYVTAEEFEAYKLMLNEWGTAEGVHSLSSPRIEIEAEAV
jgi:hypothetical protein